MKENALHLLGLMRRANAIAIGEENTGSSVRAGRAKLLLLASDASDNACRRAEGFAAGRRLPLVGLPFTKEEFSSAVGVRGGSMAAITDLGFADALLRLLSGEEPERYAAAAAEIGRLRENERKAAKARDMRIGKRRTNG